MHECQTKFCHYDLSHSFFVPNESIISQYLHQQYVLRTIKHPLYDKKAVPFNAGGILKQTQNQHWSISLHFVILATDSMMFLMVY